jgi:hypothetical protein
LVQFSSLPFLSRLLLSSLLPCSIESPAAISRTKDTHNGENDVRQIFSRAKRQQIRRGTYSRQTGQVRFPGKIRKKKPLGLFFYTFGVQLVSFFFFLSKTKPENIKKMASSKKENSTREDIIAVFGRNNLQSITYIFLLLLWLECVWLVVRFNGL